MGLLSKLLPIGGAGGGGGDSGGGGADPLHLLASLLGPLGGFGGGPKSAGGGGMQQLQAPQPGRPQVGGPLSSPPWQGAQAQPFVGGAGMGGQKADIQKLIQMLMAGKGGGMG